MTDKETTVIIYDTLEQSFLHKGPAWITLREVRCGTGYRHQNQRSFDLIAISSLNGNAVEGYEVKSSRSDFLSDIKNAEKQKALRCFANLFYYIAPEGIVKKEELPPWAGLKVLRKSQDAMYSLEEIVRPPFLPNFPPTWGFLAECIRNRTQAQFKMLEKQNEVLFHKVNTLNIELQGLRLGQFSLKEAKENDK